MRALKQFLKQKKGYCERQECKCNLISLWRDYQGHPEYCGCGVENTNKEPTATPGSFKPIRDVSIHSLKPEKIDEDNQNETITEETVEENNSEENSTNEEITEETTEEPDILDLNELNS